MEKTRLKTQMDIILKWHESQNINTTIEIDASVTKWNYFCI